MTITTWDQLQREFLKKYFPIGKTNQIRKAITSFTQLDGELFHETWERLKELIRKCPHHAVPKWQLVQCFYDGLSERHRQMVDASCGGTFMLKNEHEAWQLFETLSENSLHHMSASRRDQPMTNPKRGGIYEVGNSVDLHHKVAELTQRLDQLCSLEQPPAPPGQRMDICSICSSPAHLVYDCPAAHQFPEFIQEQVNQAQTQNFRPGLNPYSNTYNQGWKNHPNLSWRPQPGTVPTSQRPNSQEVQFRNQSFSQYIGGPQHQISQPQPPPQNYNSGFEEKVLQALKGLEMNTQILHSHTQSIAKLETQIGQLATAFNKREEGKLPSQPISNPKGQYMAESSANQNVPEHAQAVMTLRNGKTLNQPEQNQELEPQRQNTSEKSKPKEREEPTEPTPASRVPFPSALESPLPLDKKGIKMNEMLELFKQVQINLPLLDAIKQVPTYAKFLKDLCTQKRRTRAHTPKKIHLTEQASSIFQHTTPPKLKDPGTPIISCIIGDLTIKRALLDLGASVNLLPSSVYDLFGFGELKPTTVTLQLADRSIKVPRGLLEDVLVKVDEFYFPVDFLVLDMESGCNANQIPIILGRPFLATANACINCRTGVMDVSFGNKKLRLNIFNVAGGPSKNEYGEINALETSEPTTLSQDPLQTCLAHFNIDNFDLEGYMGEVNALLEPPDSKNCDLEGHMGEVSVLLEAPDLKTTPPWNEKDEQLPVPDSIPLVPSFEVTPTIEFKPFPIRVEYTFLELNETILVIITADLTLDQDNQTVGAFKKSKEIVGWTIADLNINVFICMYPIHYEENAKSYMDMQRKIDLVLKGLIKKGEG